MLANTKILNLAYHLCIVSFSGDCALKDVDTQTANNLPIHPSCYVHPPILMNADTNCVNGLSAKWQPSVSTLEPASSSGIIPAAQFPCNFSLPMLICLPVNTSVTL